MNIAKDLVLIFRLNNLTIVLMMNMSFFNIVDSDLPFEVFTVTLMDSIGHMQGSRLTFFNRSTVAPD